MAGGGGEMTYMPFFENCILTCGRRVRTKTKKFRERMADFFRKVFGQ